MKNDIRTFDLNLLKALDALLDERSVTAAAKRLSLTQPAVSGMLTRLRECFDDPLFIRNQRGMTPTVKALALSAPIKKILNEAQGLMQPSTFNPTETELSIRIAATDYALKTIIVPLLVRLRQEAPRMKIAVLEVAPDQVASMLETGLLDFALMTPEQIKPNLHAQHLFDEEYVCVVSPQHKFAQQKHVELDEFCEQVFVLVSNDGGAFSGVTDQSLAKLGLMREVMLSINSFLIVPDILAQTDLIAVIPKRLVQNMVEVVQVPVPLQIKGFSKMLVWHERTHQHLAHQWLREQFVQISI